MISSNVGHPDSFRSVSLGPHSKMQPKCNQKSSKCSVAVTLSFPSDARQNLRQCFVPGVLTQFCPQGKEKMFHDLSHWTETKPNIWTAAATKWTKGKLLVVFLRWQEVDFMTTNIQHACHAGRKTIPNLDFCV